MKHFNELNVLPFGSMQIIVEVHLALFQEMIAMQKKIQITKDATSVSTHLGNTKLRLSSTQFSCRLISALLNTIQLL